MEPAQADALIAFAKSVHEAVKNQGDLIVTLTAKVDAELAETRDGLLGESNARSRQVARLEERIIELERIVGEAA